MTAAFADGKTLLGRRIRLIRPSVPVLMVATFVLIGILAPVLAPYDPTEQDLRNTLAAPSPEHILGTDHLGRDEFSRVLVGAQTSLVAVVGVATVAVVVGVFLGVASGYIGGRFDMVVMRAVDLFLGLPALVLGLALVGLVGPSLLTLIIALGLTWWPQYARFARSQVLVSRRLAYVEALQVLGMPPSRILARHLVPSVAGPVAILLSTDAGVILLAVAGFSFLGLGVQPPTPEWGQMLVEARPYLQSAPILALAPGTAILLVVLSFNLLADRLSHRLDPGGRSSA